MQVSTKKTAKEVWESLKTRFVGADRVKTVRLAMLKGEFDKLCMVDSNVLDGQEDQRHGREVHWSQVHARRRHHGEEAARHRA
jgi:hypothetical protein